MPTSLILAPEGRKLFRFCDVGTAAEIFDALQQVREAWQLRELPKVDDFGNERTVSRSDHKPEGISGIMKQTE